MRKIFAHILAIAVFLSIFSNVTLLSASAMETRQSTTIESTHTSISQSASGEVRVTFDIVSKKTAQEIGASSIQLYSSSGKLIQSTTSSSMKEYNVPLFTHDVYFSNLSKGSYYAKVTLFATINGVTDRKTMTTNTIAIS